MAIPKTDVPTKVSFKQRLDEYLALREPKGGVWGFFAALRRSLGRVALGLELGFLCILVSSLITGKSLSDICLAGLDHLGMAFLVAAIAVFGYEWQSHYKELFNKLSELKNVILGLKDIVLGLKTIVQGEARVGIGAALKALFPDASHELNHQIRESLQSIVTAIDSTETAAGWNRDVYLALVAGALTSLSDISRISEELSKTTGLFTLAIPSSAELADFMLAAQMKCMDAGDVYQVISDFSSWAHGLTNFMASTQEAVERGVKVTRIFYPFQYDAGVTPELAAKIIADHWALAKRFPETYVVAVTTTSAVVAYHEGIFFHGDRVTKFRPLDRELRRIEFTQVQREKGTSASFECVWVARWIDSATNKELNFDSLRDELQRIWAITKRMEPT